VARPIALMVDALQLLGKIAEVDGPTTRCPSHGLTLSSLKLFSAEKKNIYLRL